MSDRHQDLRRQYELLREHLAWLEKEIAIETAKSSGQPIVAAPASRPPPPSPSVAPTTITDADALLADYSQTERHDPKATKQGCLLAFGIMLALLAAGVTAAYFLFYAHR
ncbi:MAG TPA: hypothetical protein VL357_01335 [Rariglobus sp.]|jgi:hypothetical protein|nr:hypothetical protein [Rariglobus sp.]